MGRAGSDGMTGEMRCIANSSREEFEGRLMSIKVWFLLEFKQENSSSSQSLEEAVA